MEYVIRQINLPGKSARADEATATALVQAWDKVEIGKYLEWSDPDAKNGMGDDRWTDDVTKAKRFKNFEDATACWNAVSLVRPLRVDGRPNKPLTAYSITIEKVEP